MNFSKFLFLFLRRINFSNIFSLLFSSIFNISNISLNSLSISSEIIFFNIPSKKFKSTSHSVWISNNFFKLLNSFFVLFTIKESFSLFSINLFCSNISINIFEFFNLSISSALLNFSSKLSIVLISGKPEIGFLYIFSLSLSYSRIVVFSSWE